METRHFRLSRWLRDDDRRLELLVDVEGRASWRWLPVWTGLARPEGGPWFEVDRVRLLAVRVLLAELWHPVLLPSADDNGRAELDAWCRHRFSTEIELIVNQYLLQRVPDE